MTLTIARRLFLGFAAVAAMSGGVLLYQMQLFGSVIDTIRAVTADEMEIIASLRQATQHEFEASLRTGRAFAIANGNLPPGEQGAGHEIARLADEHRAALAAAADGLDQVKVIAERRTERAIMPERLQLWHEIDSDVSALVADFHTIDADTHDVFLLLESGRAAEAWQRQAAVERARDDVSGRLERASKLTQDLIAVSGQFMLDRYNAARIWSLGALGAVLIAGALGAALLSRSISHPLVAMVAAVQAVTSGDLTRRTDINRQDELGLLGGHFDRMVEALAGMARQTRVMAEDVNATSTQMRASVQEQAASVTEQLAALEQTTATLNQITVSGRQMSQRAHDVSDKAEAAGQASIAGLRAVADIQQAMDGIREQSEVVAGNNIMLSERTQTIGEIILTVNDLAERSHLLALNAAIEAAAAGEHGRTFAIVAREIKGLADRAKQATAQVRTNLGDIQHGIATSTRLTDEAVQRVMAGKRQSDAAERLIGEMAEATQDSLQAFQQIVAATNQQQLGLEQVMQALQNIRDANTQTAGATRQLEGAATGLHALGQRLVDTTRSFRL